MLDVAAPKIRVVVLHPFGYIMKGKAILIEQSWIDHNLILLSLTAPRVDFTDSREGAQLRLDNPLVEILQFHRTHRTGDGVLIKLSEGGGWQPQCRLNSAWQH